MADTRKYKSISVSVASYNKLKKHAEMVGKIGFGVPLSLSQIVQHHILLADDYLNEKPLPKHCYKLVDVNNETENDWIVGNNLNDQIHTGSLKQIKQNLERKSLSPLESKVEDFLNGKDKTNANSN